MQKEYIVGIVCGAAGLLTTIPALIILIRECRRRKSCCGKSNTSQNVANGSSTSATKHTRLSTLNRVTHLFDNSVANDSSVSTFQNETTDASMKINKSSSKLRNERENSGDLSETNEKSNGDSNIIVGKDISIPLMNAKDMNKTELDKSGYENIASTTENESGETSISNASENIASKNSSKNTKTPKQIPKIPILPPNAAARLRQKHKALIKDTAEEEESNCYITPIEFAADKQRAENNDYEEIKERKQTLKHAVGTAKTGAFDATTVIGVSINNGLPHTENDTTKDKVVDIVTDKIIDCSNKNHPSNLEGGTQIYLNKQLSDLNVEMKSRLENKITYANTPATREGKFNTDSSEDSHGVYTGYVERENDEHVYSKLNAVE